MPRPVPECAGGRSRRPKSLRVSGAESPGESPPRTSVCMRSRRRVLGSGFGVRGSGFGVGRAFRPPVCYCGACPERSRTVSSALGGTVASRTHCSRAVAPGSTRLTISGKPRLQAAPCRLPVESGLHRGSAHGRYSRVGEQAKIAPCPPRSPRSRQGPTYSLFHSANQDSANPG